MHFDSDSPYDSVFNDIITEQHETILQTESIRMNSSRKHHLLQVYDSKDSIQMESIFIFLNENRRFSQIKSHFNTRKRILNFSLIDPDDSTHECLIQYDLDTIQSSLKLSFQCLEDIWEAVVQPKITYVDDRNRPLKNLLSIFEKFYTFSIICRNETTKAIFSGTFPVTLQDQ